MLGAFACRLWKAGHPASRARSASAGTQRGAAHPNCREERGVGPGLVDPQWDEIVERALPPEMLSAKAARSVRSFCPRFSSLSEADKRALLGIHLSGVSWGGSRSEAHHRCPSHRTRSGGQRYGDQTNGAQEGLLQLTYMDAKRYGCEFNWQHDKTLPERIRTRQSCSPGIICCAA